MTTTEKIAVTLALVVTIGAGFYAAKQVRDARNEVQKLRQEQTLKAEGIQQLQSDLADATNRLANVLAENRRLKANANEMELLKLRGEVTRLRPLQEDVVALQNMLKQSSKGVTEWKTNDIVYSGRADPIAALQTYIYSSFHSDSVEIEKSLVGDETDPPSPDALRAFIKDPINHPGKDEGLAGYKVLSQTWLGSDKVQVELNVFDANKEGVSVPFTLRNVNGDWRLVVFNVRDTEGKASGLSLLNRSPAR